MSVLGLGGVIEGFVLGVHEAKGVATTVLLADGRRISLPDLGQSPGNSIRAWLKRSP
jgi:hypothetical protein